MVLDACCGGRMFWFNPNDPRTVFMDKRRETHTMKDRNRLRKLVVDPDFQGDFSNMPFQNGQFSLVVFDPPHLIRAGRNGWLAKKYGKLEGDWRQDLRRGFAECFRVLRPSGTLIFKWNEYEVPVSEVLSLTPEKPLFGNRCGRLQKTHWIVFMKDK